MPTPFHADRPTIDLTRRGYQPIYHENEVNHCPGCGRTHWIIGRILAECHFCGTALPLSETMSRDPLVIVRRSRPICNQARAA